jgi:hypothetical protein
MDSGAAIPSHFLEDRHQDDLRCQLTNQSAAFRPFTTPQATWLPSLQTRWPPVTLSLSSGCPGLSSNVNPISRSTPRPAPDRSQSRRDADLAHAIYPGQTEVLPESPTCAARADVPQTSCGRLPELIVAPWLPKHSRSGRTQPHPPRWLCLLHQRCALSSLLRKAATWSSTAPFTI